MAKAEKRWTFRVAADTDRLVRTAAESTGSTLTEFVVEAAVNQAERVMADRTRFVLEPGDWERFVELLDRSPHDNPGLERLFSQPSVFAAG